MKDGKIIMTIIKMKRFMKRIIKTSNAPAAIGPYSQAVENNGILYISGQIAIDPKTGKLSGDNITDQTRLVLKNIEAILQEAGYSFVEVVKTTCLLSDIANFKAMNEEYARYYFENQPARAAFAVKDLPLGALIEIETIAMK
jgi:2-iminobutanoate/2-iminopropanoate deaminase